MGNLLVSLISTSGTSLGTVTLTASYVAEKQTLTTQSERMLRPAQQTLASTICPQLHLNNSKYFTQSRETLIGGFNRRVLDNGH